MYAGPTTDELALFPTRVVELPSGRSAYSFTMFKAPETPDELFESQYESLRREFDNIRARFAAERAVLQGVIGDVERKQDAPRASLRRTRHPAPRLDRRHLASPTSPAATPGT